MKSDGEIESRLEPDVNSHHPVFNSIIDALNANEAITYAKINHGFWERLVALEAEGFDISNPDESLGRKMDHFAGFRRSTPYMFEGGFARELFDLLQDYPSANDRHIFSAGLLGWPGRLEVAGLSHDENLCQTMIERCVPDHIQTPDADGMAFKWAIISGAYERFAVTLRQRSVLMVGNKTLSNYFDFMGVHSGRFMNIHPTEARAQRHRILGEVLSELEKDANLKMVLLQAGGSLTTWLIYHLHKSRPDVSFIDIGMGALICHPALMFSTAEGRIYRRQLMNCMERIHPGWMKRHLVADEYPAISTGRSSGLIQKLEDAGTGKPSSFFDSAIRLNQPIRHSLKPPRDESRISDIHDSVQSPYSVAVEIMKSVMSLPETDELVLCKSQEAADSLSRRLLESSGYRLDVINSVATVDQLMAEKESDGRLIVVSEHAPFKVWNRSRQLNMEKRLAAIVKNPVGLLDRPKSDRPEHEIEVLFCGESRPWGVSDCAALLVSSKLISSGNVLSKADLLSDYDCCAFIESMERYERWSLFYNRQIRRLSQLISRNFMTLSPWPVGRPSKSPAPTLRYINESPILEDKLENDLFEISVVKEKELNAFPNAKELANRIIEIPCNPYMRHISNTDFITTVDRILP